MKKVVLLILVSILFITGCEVKEVKKLTDSEKIANDFGISDKNSFVYADYKKVEELLSTEGILFIATPDDEGSIKAIKMINKVAKDNKIKKIYFYNPSKLVNNKKQVKKYNKLIEYFKDYLKEKEDKTYQLDIPIIVSIKDGNIIGYSNYFSKNNQINEDELTKKVKNKINEEYKKILLYQQCSNCN